MSDVVLTDETWLDEFGYDGESSSTSLADEAPFPQQILFLISLIYTATSLSASLGRRCVWKGGQLWRASVPPEIVWMTL